jgi:hypothetical protein
MSYLSQADYTIRCEWGQQGIEQLTAADVFIIATF